MTTRANTFAQAIVTRKESYSESVFQFILDRPSTARSVSSQGPWPAWPRQAHEALVENHVWEALVRLNPEVAAQPERADDVLYRLRAILMGVRTDGLVKANEEFAAWLAGERSMPFGADGEHVTVRLVDLEDVERNEYVVTTSTPSAQVRTSGARTSCSS